MSIGSDAFASCPYLSYINIPKSVTSIGARAFCGDRGLISAIIPFSVISIGDYVFSGCYSLTGVTFMKETPNDIIFSGPYYHDPFPDRKNSILYVPYGCEAVYRNAEYWGEFKDIVEITEKGDTNGDGQITPSDAIMIIYAYFGVGQTGFYLKAADLNGDGQVTPADAIEALYIYFGAGKNNNARGARSTAEDVKEPE